MKNDDPKSIEALLSRMDKDCATRAILSVIGGKKKFIEQFAIECGIMANRSKNKGEIEIEVETKIAAEEK